MQQTNNDSRRKSAISDARKLSGTSLTRRLSVVNIGTTERRLSTNNLASIIGTTERRLSTFNLATIPQLGMKDINDTAEELKRTPSDWLREPKFYLIGFCYLSSRLIYVVSVGYIVFYVEFTLLLEKENNAIVPLIMFISGFIMSGVLEVLKRRLSIETIYIASSLIGVGKILYYHLRFSTFLNEYYPDIKY